MNPGRAALRWMMFAAALGATVTGLPAQTEPVPSTSPGDVRSETLRLIAADARRTPAPVGKPAAAPGGLAPVTVMAPYVLEGTKVPRALDPVPATRFQRFQEDGTLFHLVGPHVTTNVFLHFYRVPEMNGGNANPGSGIQLGVGFSW